MIRETLPYHNRIQRNDALAPLESVAVLSSPNLFGLRVYIVDGSLRTDVPKGVSYELIMLRQL